MKRLKRTRKPKKWWGQNFLRDRQALKAIIAAAELQETDRVLEIGPGEGVLTRELTKKAKEVKAVELDYELAQELSENSAENLEVIEADFLQLNLPQLLEDAQWENYKVVANIPYYITGKIIRKLLETSKEPELLVLLIQKEVAERICATGRQSTGKTSKGSKGGKMSILAVAVQVFGAPQLVQEVPRESFWPTPEVDSAILKIIPHPDPILEKEEEKAFFRLVKMGFSSPRKQLINNLKAGLSVARPELEVIFQELDLHSQIRPGELTVEDWKNLSRKLRIGDNN